MPPDTPNSIAIHPALMGAAQTGKSNLMLRFTYKPFKTDYKPSMAVDLQSREFSIGNQTCSLHIWDTAGEKRFSPEQETLIEFYKSKDVVLIVFDITLRDTFENLQAWIDTLEASETPASKIPKILVGNKLDLQAQRTVTKQEAAAFAAQRGMPYFETSAQDGKNVEALLNEAANLGLRYTAQKHQAKLTRKMIKKLNEAKLMPHAALNSLTLTIPDALEKTHLEHLNEAFGHIYSAAKNYPNTQKSKEDYLGSPVWKKSWDEARTIMLDKIYNINMEKEAKLALIDTAKNMDFFKLHVNTSFQRTRGTPSAIEKLEKWAKELQKYNTITSKFIPSEHARRDNKTKFNTIKP